jgi:hypothetical protein
MASGRATRLRQLVSKQISKVATTLKPWQSDLGITRDPTRSSLTTAFFLTLPGPGFASLGRSASTPLAARGRDCLAVEDDQGGIPILCIGRARNRCPPIFAHNAPVATPKPTKAVEAQNANDRGPRGLFRVIDDRRTSVGLFSAAGADGICFLGAAFPSSRTL